MAEQLFNLYNSTVNSSYTAGSGTLIVASATGLPASGSYSLLIRDAVTQLPKLLLRASARTGTTLTVAAEGSDVNASVGDLVSGGMLTALSIPAYLATYLAAYLATSPAVVTKTANYTITNADSVILANAASGPFTLSLPPAATANKTYTIKKIDNTSNAVTIDGNGSETIDDALTQVVTIPKTSLTFVTDGSNWHIT